MFVPNPEVIHENRLRAMARNAKNGIKDIYLHWTAGYYGQDYDDYHLCIDKDGTVYVNCQSLLEFKQHTYGRNHSSIGIALCCGVDACCWLPDGCSGFDVEQAFEMPHCARTECALVDFGPEPPTVVQIEAMARVVAILCEELCLPITPQTVMTHCEAAFADCYGPGDGDADMRWDLWFLPQTNLYGELEPGGPLLRGKANYYLQHMENAA
ncbi:N-acetylmuramoyl-L-alanine amidase [uncultured Succiniclasticum sp.]|uniref:peptidoglycan recognition protein family protein n=1 Tax=uncultured Succiniclasticum sp. TaxID=1500547 RepID=UPI0025EC0009|nr:N-acetylmuramoyl-L-alanine amidase [uncultured Succiniclasticum sp.]